MTPEEQQIAILKEMGWTETESWLDGRRCFERADSNSGWNFDDLPDYLNDLNAMHEAEKILNLHQQLRYQIELGGYMADNDYWSLYHSTAAKRAEAFLKTIDKWTTNEPTKP